MKVTNNDIFNGYYPIARMLGAGLRPKATFLTSRLVKTLGPILDEILANKQELLIKYAILKEDGTLDLDEKGVASFETKEKEEQFFTDVKELFNVEIEIPCDKIKIDDLESAERNIPSQDILNAMAFIEE